MEKYKDCTYHTCYFRGGSNIDLNFITCGDKIVITKIAQNYVLHWYHTYILQPGINRTEAMFCQHLYCPVIRNDARKEVTNYDTCQHKKRPNKKYGKLPAKKAEEIPRNKLGVYLFGTYVIRINGQPENMNIKAVTTIDPVTGWSKITQYNDNRPISISNLVETTCLYI